MIVLLAVVEDRRLTLSRGDFGSKEGMHPFDGEALELVLVSLMKAFLEERAGAEGWDEFRTGAVLFAAFWHLRRRIREPLRL